MSNKLYEQYDTFLTEIEVKNDFLRKKWSYNKESLSSHSVDTIKYDINELRNNPNKELILNISPQEEIPFVNFIADSKIALDNIETDNVEGTIVFIKNALLKISLYLNSYRNDFKDFNKSKKNTASDINILEAEINGVRNLSSSLNYELENAKTLNQDRAKEFTQMTEAFKSDLNKFKDDNKAFFSDLELIRQQANFHDVAKAAKTMGNNWIWGIVLSIGAIIGFSCYFSQSFLCDFDDYYNTRTTFFQSQEEYIFYIEIAKRLVFKVLIITILLALLRFSIKNYNAARHSYTVNMHKSSFFGAVYDISRAITDETTRSTLINLAGKEIFVQSKSGYLSNEETKLDLKFLEKVGAVFNKKSEDV